MKRNSLALLLIVISCLAYGQGNDDVKINNKKVKEKEGPKNNSEIKKSKKEMAKQMDEWDKKKYKKEVGHKHKDENKEDKADKKAEKKAL